MSYAGPVSRPRRGDAIPPASPRSPRSAGRPSTAPPPGSSFIEDERADEWQQLALFGAGLALGIAVGAGAALLTAPRTGSETRAVLAAGVSRARRSTSRRGCDAWDDLRHEIRSATRAFKRRKARRELERESER